MLDIVPSTETLSEEVSKRLLAPFGLPFAVEKIAHTI